jgi:hypothetical protein
LLQVFSSFPFSVMVNDSCSGDATAASSGLVMHRGACHCRAVTFEFDAAPALVRTVCNCSVCHLKQNAHAIVPAARFRLLSGKHELSLYTFNTGRAKHLFCKICGVQAFYIPRSNPDGVAVTVNCVDPSTITSVTTEYFDGEHWEQAYAASDIAKYSKL